MEQGNFSNRVVNNSIKNIFWKRWSPRKMAGQVKKEELFKLFEAARWAPSAFNEQPWRFLYAENNTKQWDNFFNLLVDANKVWVKDASFLLLVISSKNFKHNNKSNETNVFDTGSAWQNLALQGSEMNLVVHAMSGFDHDKARSQLLIPDNFDICAMIAVGKLGEEIENPNERKKIEEFVKEGFFDNSLI